MSLKEQITEDMKTAMRAKDSVRLGTVRLLLAALKQKEVDERVVLDDAAVVAIVDKLIKQRKDSIEAFTKAERTDLADIEKAELTVLSAYLPLQALLAGELSAANRATPILMCHGQFDPVLPMPLGMIARDWLISERYSVEWKEYPMQHQVCQPEILDIGRWLRTRLVADSPR